DGASGAAVTAHVAALVQRAGAASNARGRWVFAPNTYPANNPIGNKNPTGTGNPAANPVGWPGIWPTAHVFASFDPAMAPTSSLALKCQIASDDNTDPTDKFINADYECDASSLHLADRATQIDSTITPGADGFSGWKYGLWVLNYLQSMHDAIG